MTHQMAALYLAVMVATNLLGTDGRQNGCSQTNPTNDGEVVPTRLPATLRFLNCLSWCASVIMEGMPVLTPNDEAILEVLTLRANLLSAGQVATTWFSESKDPIHAATRKLKRLESAGLIRSSRVTCHPLLPLKNPVFVWSPQQEAEPNFGVVAYQLQSRWTEALRPTTVIRATQMVAHRYGGKVRRLSAVQTTHDLHVAAIYLLMAKNSPEKAQSWVSEARLARSRLHQKLPDALIRDGAGEVVIEFGGAYTAERIAKVHADCEERQTPYELW